MESNPLHPLVIPLYGSTTNYPWGPPAPTSEAARLQTLNRFSPLHPSQPVSEFIISTHPSHKSVVLACAPSVTLREHIETQVIEVDASMVDFYSKLHKHGIPYILKLVSVATPQSLHVHPDEMTLKSLPTDEAGGGEKLAKAIMMVALGGVDMLFGFQAAADIVGELSRVPEFADAVGRPETDHFVHVVKTGTVMSADTAVIVKHLMQRKREFIKKCLQATVDRFLKMPDEVVTESDRLLIELSKMYPDDPMCFAPYFLNRVMLESGNAVFIYPQEPIAVLKGDFVEASTFSEYCIRGGLSEANVQLQPFLDCLVYDDSPVEISNGERFSEYGVSYVPPIPQFQLLQFKLPREVSQQMVETIAPSVILVLEGEGHVKVDGQPSLLPLCAGSVYYLNPQTRFLVTAGGKAGSVLHFIQIGVNESAAPSMTSFCVVM